MYIKPLEILLNIYLKSSFHLDNNRIDKVLLGLATFKNFN